MQTAWPTTTTVQSALAGLGITLPTNSTTLAIALGSAIERWEATVGVTPWFVATNAAASNYTLSPNGSDTLFIPPFATVTAVSIYDEVQDTDSYEKRPSLAADTYRPITHIKFTRNMSGPAGSITITGLKGFQTSIFDDVYQLVLDMAVQSVFERAQLSAVAASGASGPMTEVRQADVTVKYGGGSGASSSFADSINQRLKDLAIKYGPVSF
jgi:hypothetical protein